MSQREFSSYDTAVTEEIQWLIIYAKNVSPEFFNQSSIYPHWMEWTSHITETWLTNFTSINPILPLLRDKVNNFNMQAYLM